MDIKELIKEAKDFKKCKCNYCIKSWKKFKRELGLIDK